MLAVSENRKKEKSKNYYRIAKAAVYCSLVLSIVQLVVFYSFILKNIIETGIIKSDKTATIVNINLSFTICMSSILILISFVLIFNDWKKEKLKDPLKRTSHNKKDNINPSSKNIKPIILLTSISIVLCLFIASANIYSINFQIVNPTKTEKIILGSITLAIVLLGNIGITLIIEINNYIYKKKKENVVEELRSEKSKNAKSTQTQGEEVIDQLEFSEEVTEHERTPSTTMSQHQHVVVTDPVIVTRV